MTDKEYDELLEWFKENDIEITDEDEVDLLDESMVAAVDDDEDLDFLEDAEKMKMILLQVTSNH